MRAEHQRLLYVGRARGAGNQAQIVGQQSRRRRRIRAVDDGEAAKRRRQIGRERLDRSDGQMRRRQQTRAQRNAAIERRDENAARRRDQRLRAGDSDRVRSARRATFDSQSGRRPIESGRIGSADNLSVSTFSPPQINRRSHRHRRARIDDFDAALIRPKRARKSDQQRFPIRRRRRFFFGGRGRMRGRRRGIAAQTGENLFAVGGGIDHRAAGDGKSRRANQPPPTKTGKRTKPRRPPASRKSRAAAAANSA